MSMANAIKKNARSLATAQNTYQQNVVSVNQVVTAVLASRLPVLNTDPPDWTDFVNAYEQANSDALTWINQVMGHLLSVPDDVKDYNGVITQVLADASAQASTLVGEPSDPIALHELSTDLTTLTQQFDLVISFVSSAITAVQQFQNTLPTMATELTTIAQKSSTDAGADQQQIDDLNAAIQTLHDDISSLTAQLVALALADGIALTLGVVATIAAWPVGALVWLVMGPVVAVATYEIALDSEQIIGDKNQITVKENAITGITADVATLQLLASQYTTLSSQATGIVANLQAVLQEWQTLGSDISAAVLEIQNAIADSSSSSFQAVVTDLTEATQEWALAYSQAGSLSVQLQVNTADLELGMTPAELQAALAGGQTVDIITYWNGLGAERTRQNLAGV